MHRDNQTDENISGKTIVCGLIGFFVGFAFGFYYFLVAAQTPIGQ